MKKCIVTTTINPTTPALRAYGCMDGWDLIVIGDVKTPNKRTENGLFVPWQEQVAGLPGLDCIKMIPWNVIQRRNVGILLALQQDADLIAVIDDDNIPYDGWGENICLGSSPEQTGNHVTGFSLNALEHISTLHVTGDLVIDPIETNSKLGYNGMPIVHQSLWHRGYPIQRLDNRGGILMKTPSDRIVDVMAGMWNGDPDVDAVCRIAANNSLDIDMAHVRFTVDNSVYSPFNTQNTILSRRAAEILCLPYDIGRMDDIWAGYMAQRVLRDVGGHVMYTEPTVYQKRNPHDLSKDLADEMIGYRHTLALLEHMENIDLSDEPTVLKKYKKLVHHIAELPFIGPDMTKFQLAWIKDVEGMVK